MFVDPARSDFRLHPSSPCILSGGYLGAMVPVGADEAKRLGLSPELARARDAFTRGVKAAAAGSLAAAERLLRDCVRLDAGCVPAWVELGEAVRRQGRPREALPLFAKAQRADWLNTYPYYGLETVAFEVGAQELGQSANRAANLVSALARVRRNHSIDELDEPAARILLGTCALLGEEEAFEREVATYVRRFPGATEAASREREAFRAAVVHAAAEYSGWPQSVKPFRVKDYEALGGGQGNQQ
jgi:tetratricopeptide (TPR) repeat protein